MCVVAEGTITYQMPRAFVVAVFTPPEESVTVTVTPCMPLPPASVTRPDMISPVVFGKML